MEIAKRLLVIFAGLMVVCACNRNSDNNTGGGSENNYQSSGRATDTNSGNYAPNNTGRNERDRSSDTLTPGDQGGSDSDREITRQVRRAISSNHDLSAAAGNIKIITQNGKVTLRGPVENAQEQQTIANLAKGVEGVTSVDNQLEPKSNQ